MSTWLHQATRLASQIGEPDVKLAVTHVAAEPVVGEEAAITGAGSAAGGLPSGGTALGREGSQLVVPFR